MIVVLDPGHGGTDPGAVGPGGTKESDVALSTTLHLARRCRPPITPVLTRMADFFVALNDRAQLANDINADCFVSIHANAARNRTAHGFEVWTSPGRTKSDSLAELIYIEVGKTFPTLDARRDMSDGDMDKEARFRVLTRTVCPAVLVELAFISNPAEELLLRQSRFRAGFSKAIYRALQSWAPLGGS